MKKKNFFAWYYEQGIHELLVLVLNYLRFYWRFFSVTELTLTLLAPWHRDVVIKTWRGWSPAKSLELLVENIFSRLIGAFVRLWVIALGLLVVFLCFALGLLLVFLWIGAPVALAALSWTVARGILNWRIALAAALTYLGVVIFAYISDTRESLLRISFRDFWRSNIFDRVCARIGVTREEFKEEILDMEDQLEIFLKAHDLTLEEYRKIVALELGEHERLDHKMRFWRWSNLEKIKAIGESWRYGYTANLDYYVHDLSEADLSDYRGTQLVGRTSEFEVLKLVLERPDQNCAMIVAPSGVGKKTLIHALGRMIRHNEVHGHLRHKRLLLLDLGRAISDALNRGLDVENELRKLFAEAAYAGNVLLVLEHVEHFLGAGGGVFHPDISAVLEEFLDVPSFQIIATSTPGEYHKLLEKQENIAKYFEVIEMQEPKEEEMMDVLLGHFAEMERRKVVFTFQGLRAVLSGCNRYNWQFPLPERALDLAMNTLTYWQKKANEPLITQNTVTEFLVLKTGMPQGEIGLDERNKLLDLEKILHRHVIGQNEAISQIAQALRRARSGIANSDKPVGSFLFMGPTGVGKTETAKALAKAYFGDEHQLIRLDMSEYQSPTSIDRLIGSSQLGQPGILVSKVKDNPYGLLLLDEIEKAYPEILDLFLQILDEGYVTDAFGEKINFRNMIIIATSNAGSMLIKDLVAEDTPKQQLQDKVLNSVVEQGIFRLEFLNRFSSVIFFAPLTDEQLRSVVQLQLGKFAHKLQKEKNMEIEFGANVVENILARGYNPMFGARSLNRFVEETVEDLVARKIIAGEVNKGEKIVVEF